MMKTKKNPSTNSSGVLKSSLPVQIVAIQQKICAAVGTTIMMLDAVKKLCPSCGSPVANMWWTQTPKPMNAGRDQAEHERPGSRTPAGRVNVARIADTIPSAGRKMM